MLENFWGGNIFFDEGHDSLLFFARAAADQVGNALSEWGEMRRSPQNEPRKSVFGGRGEESGKLGSRILFERRLQHATPAHFAYPGQDFGHIQFAKAAEQMPVVQDAGKPAA